MGVAARYTGDMDWIGTVIGLVLGGARGGVVGWLLAERRARAGGAVSGERLDEATRQLAEATQQLMTERHLREAQAERERLLVEREQALQRELSDARSAASALGARLEAAQANLDEQKAMLADAQGKLREAFASVSAEALAKNNEAFLTLARERFAALSAEASGSLDQRKAAIEGLIKPLHELLGSYQQRLAQIETARVESYSMLREQLGGLAEAQRSLSAQTTQLVSALRKPQARGQWGEIALRRLVELSGMTNRCDFVEQQLLETEQGRQRPDVVVKLPGGRSIVVDCKAVLDAFLDAAAAPDEDTRKVLLVKHAQQVRSRARDLGAKAYWSQFDQSPEYVVMFLPGEAFLYAAVEADGTLIEDCLRNRVIVATPTTLIALLKAVEYGWRQDAIAENAEKIRELGTELYDRIANVGEYLDKLGKNLGGTVKSYNDLVGSIESRVLVTARKMGELGARSERAVEASEPIDRAVRSVSPVILPGTAAD